MSIYIYLSTNEVHDQNASLICLDRVSNKLHVAISWTQTSLLSKVTVTETKQYVYLDNMNL